MRQPLNAKAPFPMITIYTNERNLLPQIFIDYERSLVHTISVLAIISVIEYKLQKTRHERLI